MKKLMLILFYLLIVSSCFSKGKYPVIFIHGLGGSAEEGKGWNKQAFRDYLEEQNYTFGGALRSTSLQSPLPKTKGKVYFFIELSDPGGNINTLAKELAITIDKVLYEIGAKKVVLCGFSMGGLVARQYLLNNYDIAPQKVYRLVTLSTPHLGSPLAKCFKIFYELQQEINRLKIRREIDISHTSQIDERLAVLVTIQQTIYFFQQFILPTVKLDDIALAQLYPADNHNYLYTLQKPHPKIQYVSLISVDKISMLNLIVSYAEKNLLSYDDDFRKNLIDILKKIFAYGMHGEPNDLVVGASSQNMKNIQNFLYDNQFSARNVATPKDTVASDHTHAVVIGRVKVVRAIENNIKSLR